MDDVWKWMGGVNAPIKITLGCVSILMLVCMLSYLSRPAALNAELRDLVRQAAQLHEQSLQDGDAALGLQHSTQALTYIGFARRLAADAVIEHQTSIKIQELEALVKKTQAGFVARISSREATISAIAAGYAKL
jgi:hypothetical protein